MAKPKADDRWLKEYDDAATELGVVAALLEGLLLGNRWPHSIELDRTLRRCSRAVTSAVDSLSHAYEERQRSK